MKHVNTQGGFSLIQLSIVIIIASIGIVAVSKLATVQFYKSQEEKIDQSFDDIQDALLAYYVGVNEAGAPNRRLPCPARQDLAYDHPDFGKEDCAGVAIQQGLVPHPDTGIPMGVLRGALPVREFLMSTEDAFDVHGGQILYAVSEEMTRAANYGRTDLSAISRTDVAGGAPVGQPLPFIAISMGETGAGAFGKNGNLITPCDNTKDDGENCDNNTLFLDTLISENTNVASFYDDRFAFDPRFFSKAANAIIANADCPPDEYLTGIQEGIPSCEPVEENVPACPAGQFMVEIANGQPVCLAQNILACPAGQYLAGVSNGNPVCRVDKRYCFGQHLLP